MRRAGRERLHKPLSHAASVGCFQLMLVEGLVKDGLVLQADRAGRLARNDERLLRERGQQHLEHGMGLLHESRVVVVRHRHWRRLGHRQARGVAHHHALRVPRVTLERYVEGRDQGLACTEVDQLVAYGVAGAREGLDQWNRTLRTVSEAHDCDLEQAARLDPRQTDVPLCHLGEHPKRVTLFIAQCSMLEPQCGGFPRIHADIVCSRY
mmetsp:Transcript_77283/g.222333  ORF Transcript_77283/g.222333 Transcript_77283/m.222333 type:complete len:209 (-) Transcript_77283:2156-2782(-)